jgi:hypothetical protein
MNAYLDALCKAFIGSAVHIIYNGVHFVIDTLRFSM